MSEESITATLEVGDLSEQEIKFLMAYRSAPTWKKARIGTLAALMARVMRPGDTDQLYDQVARLFKDAPPAKALGLIVREAWQCIHRSRIERDME